MEGRISLIHGRGQRLHTKDYVATALHQAWYPPSMPARLNLSESLQSPLRRPRPRSGSPLWRVALRLIPTARCPLPTTLLTSPQRLILFSHCSLARAVSHCPGRPPVTLPGSLHRARVPPPSPCPSLLTSPDSSHRHLARATSPRPSLANAISRDPHHLVYLSSISIGLSRAVHNLRVSSLSPCQSPFTLS